MVLAWLERRGTARNRDGMERFGIRTPKRFGVSMETMRPLVKQLGRDHALALALWRTGWLEARVLASFVDEPDRVTRRQMESWVRALDNWAVCDSACFHLFDRTAHAWWGVDQWRHREEEFVRRAAFATLAGLAVHAKQEGDDRFVAALPSSRKPRPFWRTGASVGALCLSSASKLEARSMAKTSGNEVTATTKSAEKPKESQP